MQTLASYPYLTIYLHEGPRPTLELSWHGYAPSAEFRAVATQALDLGGAHQVRAWISDDRQLGAVRPRDLDWAAEVGMQRLAELGVKHFAHLEAADALNRRTIDGMYQQAIPSMPYEVRRFADIEEARRWASGAAA